MATKVATATATQAYHRSPRGSTAAFAPRSAKQPATSVVADGPEVVLQKQRSSERSQPSGVVRPEVGEASNNVLEPPQGLQNNVLEITALSGEVLVRCQHAEESWMRKDIIDKLTSAAPIAKENFYRITVGNVILRRQTTLAECGISFNQSNPATIVAVVMPKPELDQDKLMAIAEGFKNGVAGISKADLTELAALAKPPSLVETVLEATALVLGYPAPASTKRHTWNSLQLILRSPTFLCRLKEFEVQSQCRRIFNTLTPFMHLEAFNHQEVSRRSKAAASMVLWCHAVHAYSGALCGYEDAQDAA